MLGLFGTSAWANELPADATNGRRVTIFRNVAGSTVKSGAGLVLQDANTDANVLIGSTFGRESSLGLDVTTTTTADVSTFVGCVVDDSCLDDQLCRLVTWGPALCQWAGSTDNGSNTRMATVGTTTVAGQLGSGTLAGINMSLSLHDNVQDTEFNGKANLELRWIWVNPDNS
jgi:hypothetical protein